jgi:hypothetical protein
MAVRPKAVHLRDIRLFTNAGVALPVCLVLREGPLDMDNTWPTSHEWDKVTCLACKREARRVYGWAYRGKEQS